MPDIRLHAADVQLEPPGPDDGAQALAPQLRVHPGQQLGERERLGHVVPRTELEAVNLAIHIGQAGQHHHRLRRPVAQQLAQHGPAVSAGHEQVEDNQVIGLGECAPEPV